MAFENKNSIDKFKMNSAITDQDMNIDIGVDLKQLSEKEREEIFSILKKEISIN